jgi:hypothetical protein
MAYGTNFTLFTAVIVSGESLSAVVDLAGLTLAGIEMPATWTAASLTFQVAASAALAAANLYDELGSEYTATAAQGHFIAINPADFAGIKWLRVRSGSSASPVNQAGERSIILVARSIG